jgi:predicted nucleic acid-binding Zn ribbon protein
MPIYHYECANCHNLDAGFMWERNNDDIEREYYRSVVELYQSVRGFNK